MTPRVRAPFGLLRAWAETRPDHRDPKMRGRRYATPLDRVWDAAVRLVTDGGPRWTPVRVDDRIGLIRAEAHTRFFGFVDDVEIRIALDMDGRTRVDLTSRSRMGWTDLGTNGRRIRRFLHALDRTLDARPEWVPPPEGGQPENRSE